MDAFTVVLTLLGSSAVALIVYGAVKLSDAIEQMDDQA